MKGGGDVLQGHHIRGMMPSSFNTANGGTGTFTTTSQLSFFGRKIILA
jgi:hypothetical protein